LKYAKIEVSDLHLKINLTLFRKELEEIFEHHPIDYTKLIFANELYSLVPKEFYSDEDKVDFIKYNVQLLPEDNIVSEYIEDLKAYFLFIPYMNYHNIIFDFVEEFDFTHSSKLLIEETHKSQDNSQQLLIVNVRQQQIDIIGYEESSFKLCNTYSFDNEIDILYYILFCVEELNFDQEKVLIRLKIEEEEDWIEILRNYISNVEIESKFEI